MSCAKKYGPGAVIVSKESTFNRCTTFDHLISAQSVSVGALNREMIDNNELRMDRGQSASFLGSQSEIAWEIQVVATFDGTDTTTGLGCLFWGAGRENSGYLANNSICGRSLQIARFDRDGLLLEVLNGCIVQNVAYSFSANDLCTITFSGVAASKWQFNGLLSDVGATWPAEAGNITVSGEVFYSSYQIMEINLPTHKPTGFMAKLYGNDDTYLGMAEVTGIALGEYDIPTLTLTVAAGNENTPVIKKMLYYYDDLSLETTEIVSPADWHVELYTFANYKVAAQSLEITLETGLSFGDITANSSLPSEIISANNNITGSCTMYLDEKAATIFANTDMGVKLYIKDALKLRMDAARITAKPAYELAPDSAASGDFEFQGVAQSQNNGLYWL